MDDAALKAWVASALTSNLSSMNYLLRTLPSVVPKIIADAVPALIESGSKKEVKKCWRAAVCLAS